MNGNNINTPLVSVIMNCYNGEKYLKEAIDSVLKQTYTNWELIFWDNQSTDSSASIINSISDTRIKYILSQQHTTLGTARNLAVEYASGDWIAFLDCDDLWQKNKLKLQIDRILKGDNISMVYGKTDYFSNENLKFIDITRLSLPEGDIFQKLATDNFISLSSALVNKKKYWEVMGIESKFNQAEDYDLFIKLSFISRIGVVNESIVKYRVHANNLSFLQKDLAFTESIEILERYLPDFRAKLGLNYWSSFYMLFCIKRLKVTKISLIYFFKYGSVIYLFRLILRFIVKKKN